VGRESGAGGADARPRAPADLLTPRGLRVENFRMRRPVVLLLMLGLCTASPATAARRFLPAASGSGWQGAGTLLAFPLVTLQRVLAAIASPITGSPDEGLPGGQSISKRSGLSLLGFDLQERGKIAYLAVSGRGRSARAQILFDDGEMRDIDLRETTRSTGVYELLDFGADRGVIGVRVQARSVTPRSEIALRIGK